MTHRSLTVGLLLTLSVLMGACATRPVNPPIAKVDPKGGYRFEARLPNVAHQENLVVLAFSGGGTRAAAFSYGVLEFLRRAEVVNAQGATARLLDQVGVITGVSGGSFTALAYGLYGERLFDEYESRFLKRNVQGTIAARTFNPMYWGKLFSSGFDRSELSAELYDEILFNGATFGDLQRKSGPLILASATDLSSGSRFAFNQGTFDIICSDLGQFPLSRAAAASSAVPVVLTPITLNNYGGTCHRTAPDWVGRFIDAPEPPRPASRAIRALKAQQSLEDGKNRPFLHLVDGGVSDNVGMRSVLDTLELFEALYIDGQPTILDNVRRIIVIVVNSLSVPPTTWDQFEAPPGVANVLLKSAGVPIDHYSYEAVELLKDTAARWRTNRRIRQVTGAAASADPTVANALRVPQAEIYAIDVSFPELEDPNERAYLNSQPTSFTLPDEAVDRLRAAAGTIIESSPEFRRLLKDTGLKLLPRSAGPAPAVRP